MFSWSEVASVFTNAPHVLLLSLPLFFSGVTVRLFCIQYLTSRLTDTFIALRPSKLHSNYRGRTRLLYYAHTALDSPSICMLLRPQSIDRLGLGQIQTARRVRYFQLASCSCRLRHLPWHQEHTCRLWRALPPDHRRLHTCSVTLYMECE